MNDLQKLIAAVRQPDADATAFIGLADALADEGHPAAPELVELAITIVSSDDWPTVFVAVSLFLTILTKENL